jgi:hypothetical protein
VSVVLSGRGLCDGPITRPEESYRLWCVVVCDLETSWMRRPWATGGLSRPNKQTNCLQTSIQLIQSQIFKIITSHSPTNALFIKLGFKFTLEFAQISLLHVSVYDHHQGACTEPG